MQPNSLRFTAPQLSANASPDVPKVPDSCFDAHAKAVSADATSIQGYILAGMQKLGASWTGNSEVGGAECG